MGKWEEVTIGEIAFTKSGGTPKRGFKAFWDNGTIPWLKSGELNDNKNITENTEFITEEAIKNSSAKLFPKGSLLLAMYGATAGKLGILGKDAATNQAVCSIQNKKGIFIEEFVFNYLMLIREDIIRDSFGGAQPNISKSYIDNIKIPLPPLPEQQRIVTKLDGLFAKIDQAMGLLEENIAHTKALMGSVLDEEFGKLNCRSYLLKSISDKIQYGYTGKTKEKGEYYYLRITDIQDGKVDFNIAPFSDISNELVSKYILNQGDILFARTGATAGKSYLFNDEEPSIFASYLIRVVAKKEILSPNYLKWYFQSDEYWNQIFGNIVGAAQPNFNGKKLGELHIPVPNLEIQNNCVLKFEKYDKVIRKSIKSQTQKLNHLKALKSSLLDQAFKGEL